MYEGKYFRTMRKKPADEIQWNEIDKSRDDQLAIAVDQASLGSGRGLRDLSWFDRYEAALIAFEEGRPRKLINLEKSLHIVWDGNAYRRSRQVAEVYGHDIAPAVEVLVNEVCEEIKRAKRSRSWLNWIL